jgi:hypothetical protein
MSLAAQFDMIVCILVSFVGQFQIEYADLCFSSSEHEIPGTNSHAWFGLSGPEQWTGLYSSLYVDTSWAFCPCANLTDEHARTPYAGHRTTAEQWRRTWMGQGSVSHSDGLQPQPPMASSLGNSASKGEPAMADRRSRGRWIRFIDRYTPLPHCGR